MNLKTVTIADLKPHPDNPNTHPARQIDALGDSLDEFDQVKNVVIWRGMMLAGHAVREAAIKSGRLTLDAVDVSHWDEAKATAFMLADIRLPDMGFFDEAAMVEALRDVEEPLGIPGIDEEFLKGLEGWEVEKPKEDAPPDISKADELQKVWGTELGQIWSCGPHRVVCGDCTDRAVVEGLMGGERDDLCLFTDPPYGVKRDEGFEGFEGFGGFGIPIARKQYSGGWDEERPSQETFNYFINMAKEALIFGGNFFADILPKSTCWLVWDKLNTMPTFGDCELIWTNLSRKSVKKITFEYNGLIGKEAERFHATQKPLGLISELIDGYVKSTLVLDPFLGSGTTLIAAHQQNCRCFGIELDPGYVAVTLQRFLDHTSIKPELIK